MQHKKHNHYPLRFLALVPVLLLAFQLEDTVLRLVFIFILTFITSRLFPIIETVYTKEK
jgi:hypothetical protein